MKSGEETEVNSLEVNSTWTRLTLRERDWCATEGERHIHWNSRTRYKVIDSVDLVQIPWSIKVEKILLGFHNLYACCCEWTRKTESVHHAESVLSNNIAKSVTVPLQTGSYFYKLGPFLWSFVSVLNNILGNLQAPAVWSETHTFQIPPPQPPKKSVLQ